MHWDFKNVSGANVAYMLNHHFNDKHRCNFQFLHILLRNEKSSL